MQVAACYRKRRRATKPHGRTAGFTLAQARGRPVDISGRILRDTLVEWLETLARRGRFARWIPRPGRPARSRSFGSRGPTRTTPREPPISYGSAKRRRARSTLRPPRGGPARRDGRTRPREGARSRGGHDDARPGPDGGDPRRPSLPPGARKRGRGCDAPGDDRVPRPMAEGVRGNPSARGRRSRQSGARRTGAGWRHSGHGRLAGSGTRVAVGKPG